MNKPMCDCLGCAVGGDCSAQAKAPQPDQYVEDRMTLIEEMFSQLFAFLPPDAANALATEYNRRRTACILKHHPDSDIGKMAAPKPKGLILVPH